MGGYKGTNQRNKPLRCCGCKNYFYPVWNKKLCVTCFTKRENKKKGAVICTEKPGGKFLSTDLG